MSAVKEQFDQELQHFSQFIQALTLARSKFDGFIQDINSVSQPENENQELLIPAFASLYIPGEIKYIKKFMVDIGTGYYVERDANQAISFHQKD